MDKWELFLHIFTKNGYTQETCFFSSETHKYKTQQNLKFINTKPNNI